MTRWGMKDLTGQVIKMQAHDALADQWEVVSFLRYCHQTNRYGRSSGRKTI